MTSFNPELPHINEGNINIPPKSPQSKEPLLSKYLPLLEKLEKKQNIQNKISHLKAMESTKGKEIQSLFQKTVQSPEDFDQIAKLEAEKNHYKNLANAFLKHLPIIDEDAIFEVENEIDKILTPKEDFPEKEKFQKIYDERVVPLLHVRKKAITESPYHFSATAAAEKGKAAQAGLQAIKNLTESYQPVVQNSKVSQQQVFLIPKEKVVFKRSHARAEEEERLVNHLFNLKSKKGVVESFQIKTASKKRFGMTPFSSDISRGLAIQDLDQTQKNNIYNKLPYEGQVLVYNWKKAPQTSELDNYNNLSQHRFVIKQPEGEWETVSFQKLHRKSSFPHLATKISKEEITPITPETLVGFSVSDALPMGKRMEDNDSIFRGLNFIPSLESEPPTILFVPDLTDPEAKKAYEKCEQCTWSFRNSSGNTLSVDFKTFHATQLKGEFMDAVTYVNRTGEPITNEEYQKALNVPWKAINQELVQMEGSNPVSFTEVQSKPFVENMLLMSGLNPIERNTLLSRLTVDGEVNAVLTGEVQLLDLHSNNLGLVPVSTPEFERFKDLKFSTDGVNFMNFYALIGGQIAGTIQDGTVITFYENGIEIKKALKDLPELQKASNVSWQLSLFDTDLSLFEDNDFSVLVQKGQIDHMIPLRSVLLETEWKDRPLSDDAVARLLASDASDERVKQWISKADAPIYKQLSPDTRKNVSKTLASTVAKYTLSEPRSQGYYQATVKQIKNNFVSEVTDLNHFAELWDDIAFDLSQVNVLPGDNWETIAKRYHQDATELKEMNPGGLEVGKKIQINYDLTSMSPLAAFKRKKIASQLFPRLTQRQQNALLQRQERRKTYLTEYANLKNNPTIEQMTAFVQNPVAPLTSIRREDLLIELQYCKNNPRKWDSLKKTLIKDFKPTYFNMMKAMYPQLADAYALNQITYNTKEEAGQNIGYYVKPLEKNIEDAKAKVLTPQLAKERDRLVQNLEESIRNIPNPTYFGVF